MKSQSFNFHLSGKIKFIHIILLITKSTKDYSPQLSFPSVYGIGFMKKIAFIFLLLPILSIGQDYYVSADGTGNGSSSSTPMSFASAKSQISSMSAGEVMAFKGGDEFDGDITISGNNITFTSYGTGQAIFRGSETLNGFSNQGGNIWTKSTSTVYGIGGQQNARIPDLSYPEDSSSNWLTINSVQNSSTQFTCNALAGQGYNLVGATVYIQMNPFERGEQIISAFNSSTGRITLSGAIESYETISSGDVFWIQNHPDLLTVQGEWSYQNGTLSIYSTTEPTNVEATTLNDDIIKISNSDYVTIDNLNVKGTNQAGIRVSSSHNCTLTNNTIEYTNDRAVYPLSSNDLKFTDNTISNCHLGIATNDAERILIEDNIIENIYLLKNFRYTITGYEGKHGIYINTSSDDAIIRYNTISNCGFNGISSYRAVDILIDKNYVENACQNMHDGAGIYSSNHIIKTGSEGTISNNIVVYDNSKYTDYSRQAFGIYNDDNGHDMTITGNTLIGGRWGVFVHNTKDSEYSYNNIYLPWQHGISFKSDGISGEVDCTDNTIQYNEIYLNNSSYACLKHNIDNRPVGDYDFVETSDYNKFINPLRTHIIQNEGGIWETLAQWRSASGYDANSVDDSSYSINDSQVVYNATKVAVAKPLSGTWYDLDGTSYSGAITLQPYAGKILIQTTGQFNANAGPDEEICLGESVTLTANGGSTYSWNTGATTQSITVNPDTTTTYTVTVYEDGNSDSDDVIVTVNPVPIANAGEDVEICQDESITLTASGGDSYEWSNGQTTQSIDVSPSETTTYTVTVTSNGCSATDAVTVTVNPRPAINAGNDVDIYQNESITLTAIGDGTITWSTGEETASITVSPLETTTYTVTATLNGCTNTDEITVTVLEQDTVTADAGQDVSICINESVTLTANGGTNYTYLWSTGATTQNIDVSPSETSTYSVTVTNGTASDTDDVVVTVNPLPVVNAGNDIAIYQNESITLTSSGDGTFIWNTGDETESITVSPLETTTYTVTATLDGCSSSDSVTVTVLEPDTVSANAGEDKSICENESVTLTASGGPYYLWSTGETTQSIIVSPLETTTYTVTVSNDFISDSDDVVVTVNPVPVAYAGEERAILSGDSIPLTASGGSEFLWSTGETTQEIMVSPTDTTTYTVEVFENGCSDIASVTVIVGVSASVGGEQTICQGQSTTLYAAGGSYFEWNTGQTTQSIVVSPSQTTTYSVIVSNNSSSDEAQITVNVNLVPVADAGEDVTIESGQNITLSASGGNTYLWNNGETTQSISVSPTDTTIYTVEAFVNGCSNTDAVKVTVVQQVNASAGDDVEICLGESITLTASGGEFYRWLHTNEETASIFVSPDETSTYTVEVSNGFSTQTADVTVGVLDCQAINNEPQDLEFDFLVYPNPTEGQINIKLSGLQNISSIYVSNVLGKVIKSESFEHENGTVINKLYDFSSLSKGVYFITFKQSGEPAMTKKIILQ
jgi:parallel beta-helix repeat protein